MKSSPGAAYKVGNTPLVTILGIIGFLLGGAMILMFMFDARLGLTSTLGV